MKLFKLLMFSLAVGLCFDRVNAWSSDRLTVYPPTLREGGRRSDVLEEIQCPKGSLKAFYYSQMGDKPAIVGVVNSANAILWQKTTGAKAISKIFWSSDCVFLIFYTTYWYNDVSLYAKGASKNNRDTNYLYVIDAQTGKVVYELDPDIKVLHLDKMPDPRKWRPTLVGGGVVDKVDIAGGKLTVSETVIPPNYSGDPVPPWLRRPFSGSIVIPAMLVNNN